ncbi:MAG: arginase family protein [Solirubrobacterales bacterium]|nr:arginase family protein [Solirubrobacterales bacterium]MBV9796792.1 arginase family protein [Solirubrobacterales bacterium]
MELRLLCLPYHNGLRNVGMGRGASKLVSDEALRRGIEAQGWRLTSEEIQGIDESVPEIARVMELDRHLSIRVREAAEHGAFPLVLAGNCNSCLGTAAGIGAAGLGVIWFDAHADFDDPDENTSGFFDVMGLAMLTGRGWRGLRQTLPGLMPVAERNVILAAVRDLEPYQRKRLERSAVLAVPDVIDVERFDHAVQDLATRASRVYLHLDLDSIDIDDAKANQYAAGGGPCLERLEACIRLVCRRLNVAAASITAYDPAFDEDGRALAAARRVAHEIAKGVRSEPMT